MQEQSISELQKKMTSGELTARQLTELFLERIDSLDRNGPRLNSVIETNPDALEIASTRDGERFSGFVRGPLHGIRHVRCHANNGRVACFGRQHRCA